MLYCGEYMLNDIVLELLFILFLVLKENMMVDAIYSQLSITWNAIFNSLNWQVGHLVLTKYPVRMCVCEGTRGHFEGLLLQFFLCAAACALMSVSSVQTLILTDMHILCQTLIHVQTMWGHRLAAEL